ncbi:RNA polymerase recycling motor HelD [Paenibacillus bovis]|uniref:Helicase n=1 Tax=Paenibacillus bovis TaxID=1616788 RepID=A0A172ZFW7_9BACL|nr:RNA polymerase recycling motor HelD [Paenibacillus bovis]ANF96429.1 helicase [Paenibacillus bovis]
MAIEDQDWQAEQDRVNDVTAKINSKIRVLEQQVGESRGDVVGMRKDFWDEVSINFSEQDDVGETSTSLRQQSQVLSELELSHRRSSLTLDKLRRLSSSPYFGRIDFKEKDGGPTDRIYLGIGSFLDENEEDFLIYDWRAPVSSLYYDGAPGPASYRTPVGSIEGDMELKRQFVIRDANIKVLFDTGVTIGDELLQQVLSHTADNQMKNIVATIQKEQNSVIRNDRSRMLIVQGAAGSGKTSAALQRVAYLLYRYRESLRADQMVLFSPNSMFNSYVSTVLPELGEENMLQTTFQAYLEVRIGHEFDLEDIFSQMEYLLAWSEDDGHPVRVQGIRYKSSAEYFKAIRRYADLLLHEGMSFRAVRFQGREIVSRQQMLDQFYSYDPAVKLGNRIELLREWLLKEVNDFGRRERKEPWVEEQIQTLSTDDYHRAYTMMRRKQKNKSVSFDDFQLEAEMAARMVVNNWLKPLRKWVKRLRFIDLSGLYRRLFTDEQLFTRVNGDTLPAGWHEFGPQTVSRMQKGELAYEDATPYLYLKEHLQGFRSNTSIKHMIVDEVQDYSPFQLEFMKRLFPRARMTALGDLNQAIYSHNSVFDEEEPLLELYGKENTELIRLTRSYRSTYEIVDFTRQMIPGGEHIVPFNRRGDKPVVSLYNDREEMHQEIVRNIHHLQQQGYQYTAIICKTESECTEAYEALKDQITMRKMTKNTPIFEKGTIIIPAYLAKGVEFDAVILYDASRDRYNREAERKLFYTACTRAMHLLYLYAIEEPTPLIQDVNPESYVLQDYRD